MSPFSSSAPQSRRHRLEMPRPIEELREHVQRLDPELDMDSSAAQAAILLLAGLQMEHNVVKLARFTRLDSEFVSRCVRRLIDNGVWQGGETICAWNAGETIQRAFWSDVAVAEGQLCRRSDEEGRLQWAPQGHWWKSFEHVTGEQADPATLYHAPHPEPEPAARTWEEPASRKEQPASRDTDGADLFPGAVWL